MRKQWIPSARSSLLWKGKRSRTISWWSYRPIGAKVIEESGLGDEQGWLPTDRATLEVKGQEHIYALGDATDLPVSKSGSAAHFEAKVVAHRLITELHGEEPRNG